MRHLHIFAIIFAACITPCVVVAAEELSQFAFAKEYIQELGELESLRESGEIAVKAPGANPFSEFIYYSTRVQFALKKDISRLENLRLAAPVADAPNMIASFHKQKLEVHERMVEIETQLMGGPKSDVDYGKLGAELPKLRASLDNIDESFMNLSNLVFIALIDTKPDKAGHMSKLVISSIQRQELIRQIRANFGKKLDLKIQPYLTSAASVLLGNLQKDYTCSDEGSNP